MNKTKTVVAVIAENMFRDEELLVPKSILSESGLTFLIASTTKEEATGKLGAKIKPDMLIDEINIEQIAALVFIGGAGCKQYLDNKTALDLAREALTKNKIVAAICSAPAILAKSGILKGKKATVFPADACFLEEAGAVYTKESLTCDGNIITADCVDSAEIFAKKLTDILK